MHVSPLPSRRTHSAASLRLLVERPLAALAAVGFLPVFVWVALFAGALIVAYAYSYAATVYNTGLEFHLFWFGVLLFMVPAGIRICNSGTPRAERLAIIAAVGLFQFLPKYLRSTQYPIFFDELSHWRQANQVYATGRLFIPNPSVYMSQYFPGLHALTAALRDLTGLPTFDLGNILLAVLHVIALVGVFVLAERMTHSPQVAGIAAFIYGINPAFMYFDSQYAYESLAIVFFIWVIVAILNVQDAVGDWPRQVGWFVAGIVLAGACITTHHLTSYAMVGLLLLIAAVTMIRVVRGHERRDTAWITLAFALVALAGAVAWFVFEAPTVADYLLPSITRGFTELTKLVKHQQQSRTLFVKSASPYYERLAGYLAPMIMAFGSAAGLWLLRRRPPRSSAAYAILAFGLFYFVSAPFILTQYGSEGARRSWAFSYIGLSLLVAPAVVWLIQALARRRPNAQALARAGATALLCVVLIGNVTTEVNDTYRFPGPYVYGSDTRSLTTEAVDVARWFDDTQGTDAMIIADRYNSLAFASFGLEWPATVSWQFPLWNLYFSTKTPDPELLRAIRDSGYEFLVIDKRMAHNLPLIGVYFQRDEPDAIIRSTPPPQAALDKYEHLPWVIKIFQSTNLEVYRFNFSALHLPPKPNPVTARGHS